jgi:hypothetical protein
MFYDASEICNSSEQYRCAHSNCARFDIVVGCSSMPMRCSDTPFVKKPLISDLRAAHFLHG